MRFERTFWRRVRQTRMQNAGMAISGKFLFTGFEGTLQKYQKQAVVADFMSKGVQACVASERGGHRLNSRLTVSINVVDREVKHIIHQVEHSRKKLNVYFTIVI